MSPQVNSGGFQIEQPRLSLRNFLLWLLLTVAVNTLIAVVLTAIGFGLGFVPSLIFSQCIGLSIYLCNLAARPVYRRARRLSAQIIVIAAFITFGAAAGTMLGSFANRANPFVFLREHSALFSQSILIALLFGAIVSYVFISLGMLAQEKVKRLEIEKSAAETELKLLQSQMEPHFLFNTLSNVISLIDTDPEKARRMLESFTAFLRRSFITSRERTVTLSQELDVVRSYLDIFSMRMGDRLEYVIDVQEEIRNCRIPPLLIQPLVENAVKHGLAPSLRGGTIKVQGSRSGNSLSISVSDSGQGINERSAGSGVGLDNIGNRLRLLYGQQGSLQFEENKPCGTTVTIEIPYETDSGDNS